MVPGLVVLGQFLEPVLAALDIMSPGLVKWKFEIGDETICRSVRYTF